jgi:Holliday junction resolvase-like predicted endonuclease
MGMFLLARNYVPREIKGEIDLIGYDGETLVFVEVRTRTRARIRRRCRS